jgi:hypothetical protein
MATERVIPTRETEPSVAEVVRTLVAVLGDGLVAIMAGITSGRVVHQWASGEQAPPPEIEERLRWALRIVELLREREGDGTIRAWWVGMNPELGDRAPALVLHERPEYVLDAAYCFLAQ